MKHLDFIVFGVGRSGTSALANSLNLHPEVFCGIERFHYNVAPERIVFPESFRDQSFVCAPANAQRTEEELKSKGDSIMFAGNKNPRYFCALEAWRKFNPAIKKIAIYRSPWHYLASWKNRAERQNDAWHPALQGPFGLYELFEMLRATIDFAEDTLLVPYDALYFENDQAINQILDHLGADPARFPRAVFIDNIFAQPGRTRERPALDPEIADMLDIARIDDLDRLLLRADPYRIGDIRYDIEQWLESLPGTLGELAEAWLLQRDNDQLHELLVSWVRTFPKLGAGANPSVLPPTFKAYHDLLFGAEPAKRSAALALHDRAVKLPAVNMILARIYTSQGNPREASKALRSVIEANPRLIAAYRQLALLLSQEGRWQEAASVIALALEFAADNVDPLKLFSEMRAAFKAGEPAVALGLAEKALRTSFESFECHRIRALSLSRLQRHDEAMAACEDAISRYPDDQAPCQLAISVAIAARNFSACQDLILRLTWVSGQLNWRWSRAATGRWNLRLTRSGGQLNCALLFNVLKNTTVQLERDSPAAKKEAVNLENQVQILRKICDLTGRRLFLLTGNCQTPVLAEILNNCPAFAARHFAYCYKDVHACSQEELAKLAETLDRFDGLITQNLFSENFGALRTAEIRNTYRGQIVTIPTCWFNVLSLDAFRLSQSREEINPDANMHSLFLAQAFLDGLSEEQAISFHREADLFTPELLQNRFQEAVREIQRRENELDVAISDYILDAFTSRRLFYSYNHPSLDLLLNICESLAGILGFTFPKDPVRYATFDRLSNPQWHTHHKIRSHFQLNYAEEEGFVFNDQQMDIAQFAHREYTIFSALNKESLAAEVAQKTKELSSSYASAEGCEVV
jgi:tetratricopeptide (TPR) repeat protein